jgi:two-component system, chemotaxis family, chemotaxis protein CheY
MSWRVLVVDDSAIVRAMVRKALGMSGATVSSVQEAGNGREALAVLAAEPVDVVFADINMPEMSGLELVQAMQEDAALAAIPIVVVSSERNEARMDALRDAGVRAYLRKPFRPEDFRDVLQALAAARGGGHA